MKVSKDTIVKDVEICIDEIAPNDAQLEGLQDDTERATIIKSKIIDALKFVLTYADWSLLEPSNIVTSQTPEVNSSGMLIGRYKVPDNFLRLVYVNFVSWSRSLHDTDIIPSTDPEYAMLKDPYCTGIPERPKLGQTYDGTTRVLELYTAKDEDDRFTVAILEEPTDDEDEVSIPQKVYRAVIYYISGLVFTTYAEAQKAQMMFSEANDLIGFTAMAQQSQATPQQVETTQQ